MRNSFVGFSDIGSLVENAVFLRLVNLYGVENVFYLGGTKGEEVDFVVKTNRDEVILFESKYNNLESAIINSLSDLFLKIYMAKNH